MNRLFSWFGLAVALTSAAPAAFAQARAFDAKALARYDISYARCEARFPDMRGHRDEAYLNLWRIRSDEKSAARLAGVRGGSVYRAEQKLVQKGAPASAASAPPLERECQGLWAEHQRVIQNKR
jgi:hypothetical protein